MGGSRNERGQWIIEVGVGVFWDLPRGENERNCTRGVGAQKIWAQAIDIDQILAHCCPQLRSLQRPWAPKFGSKSPLDRLKILQGFSDIRSALPRRFGSP